MARIEMKQATGILLAGAMMGATLALLYAPQSGIRTRKNIRKVVRETSDRLDDFQGDFQDHVGTWMEDLTQIVKDGVDSGKRFGAEGYEQVLQGFDNAKKCVEDGKTRFELLIKTA